MKQFPKTLATLVDHALVGSGVALIVFVAFMATLTCEVFSAKNSTPPQEPPPPSVDTLYLKPTIIDRTKTETFVILKDRLCVSSPLFSPQLKCLDDNGDVMLP